jgi:putative ABC transport system permease protein
MDDDHAQLMNLGGIVNAVHVVPDEAADPEQLRRAMFSLPGVASVETVGATVRAIRDLIDEFISFLDVVRGAVLLLALLIAFNSSSISADERARDHATMFAFGLPVRSVLGAAVVESFIVGVLGTALGVLFGIGLLNWLVRVLLPGTLPDLALEVEVALSTFVTAGILGVLVVSLAPLLTLRKLRRMDIPSTLRVVE